MPGIVPLLLLHQQTLEFNPIQFPFETRNTANNNKVGAATPTSHSIPLKKQRDSSAVLDGAIQYNTYFTYKQVN
jgi:hypothetical protein